MQALIQLSFGPGSHDDLRRDVVDILRGTLTGATRPKATRAEVLKEQRALEQRIDELKRLLGASEEELERLVREKSVDPGLSSLYRSVQGLDPSERNFTKKKELLAVIYQANVELLRQLQKETPPE